MTQIRIAAARRRSLRALTSRRYEGRIRPEATTASKMTEKNGAVEAKGKEYKPSDQTLDDGCNSVADHQRRGHIHETVSHQVLFVDRKRDRVFDPGPELSSVDEQIVKNQNPEDETEDESNQALCQ